MPRRRNLSFDPFAPQESRTSRNSRTKSDSRKILPQVLIVCEDKVSAPNYFRAFRIQSVNIEIYGAGRNCISLVEFAEKMYKKEETKDHKKFDSVWCVFDKDDFPPQNFHEAIKRIDNLNKSGKKPQWHAAYSNECFELWYLLHFQDLLSQISRNDYNNKLNIHFNQKYEKNQNGYYNLLQEQGDEDQAVARAKRLEKSHDDLGVTAAVDRNPSTRVYELVVYLRESEAAFNPDE